MTGHTSVPYGTEKSEKSWNYHTQSCKTYNKCISVISALRVLLVTANPNPLPNNMKEKSSAKDKMRAERHKPLASQIMSDRVVKQKIKQEKQRSRQEEQEVS